VKLSHSLRDEVGHRHPSAIYTSACAPYACTYLQNSVTSRSREKQLPPALLCGPDTHGTASLSGAFGPSLYHCMHCKRDRYASPFRLMQASCLLRGYSKLNELIVHLQGKQEAAPKGPAIASLSKLPRASAPPTANVMAQDAAPRQDSARGRHVPMAFAVSTAASDATAATA
jgi:hypothetical protein